MRVLELRVPHFLVATAGPEAGLAGVGPAAAQVVLAGVHEGVVFAVRTASQLTQCVRLELLERVAGALARIGGETAVDADFVVVLAWAELGEAGFFEAGDLRLVR